MVKTWVNHLRFIPIGKYRDTSHIVRFYLQQAKCSCNDISGVNRLKQADILLYRKTLPRFCDTFTSCLISVSMFKGHGKSNNQDTNLRHHTG